MEKQSHFHTVLWALAVSMLAAAATLWLIFKFVLPPDKPASPPPAYTIGVWEGKVAVFERDQEFPKQVYDTYVVTLPEKLRQQVEEGVPAESAARLSVLLEDYTS